MESRSAIAAIVCEFLRRDPDILKKLADGDDAETERLIQEGLPKLVHRVLVGWYEGLQRRPDDAPVNEDIQDEHVQDEPDDGVEDDRPDW